MAGASASGIRSGQLVRRGAGGQGFFSGGLGIRYGWQCPAHHRYARAITANYGKVRLQVPVFRYALYQRLAGGIARLALLQIQYLLNQIPLNWKRCRLAAGGWQGRLAVL